MNLSDIYVVDAQKIDGVWINKGAAKFKISFFNSTKVQLYFTQRIRIYAVNNDEATANLLALHDTIAKLIVVDWENVEEKSDDGLVVSVNYSESECLRLLKKFPGLDIDLMNESSMIETFKREEIKTIEGK